MVEGYLQAYRRAARRRDATSGASIADPVYKREGLRR
jgi:hypothetical protein